MIYAVIDTNVLVSALLSKSATSTIRALITHIQDGHLTTLYNAEIIEEYSDVLSRTKFGFKTKVKNALIASIKLHGIETNRVPFEETLLDEDDRVFYEVALSKDDAYLVTGNIKHFPKTPIVVTPAEMLEILEAQ